MDKLGQISLFHETRLTRKSERLAKTSPGISSESFYGTAIPDKNCRNCGAPHDGVKCNYCQTVYSKPKPKVVYEPIEEPVSQKKWYHTAIFFLVMVAMVFVVIAIIKNRKSKRYA